METSDNQEKFQEEHHSLHLLEAKGTLVLVLDALAATEKEYRFVGTVAQGENSNFSLFYTYFHKLYMITCEQVPEDISKKVEKWLSTVVYSTATAWDSFTKGVSLFSEYQKELFNIGIKDTNLSPSADFPFEYYKQLNIEKKESEDKTVLAEVVGFTNSDFYSSKITMLFNTTMSLHSFGKNNEARDLFYNILGYFVIVFDEEFIDNCIAINDDINEDTTLSVYHKKELKYRLHLGEFSRLIMRAGVSPKPDIRVQYDVPWAVPKSLEELSFDGSKKHADSTNENNDT